MHRVGTYELPDHERWEGSQMRTQWLLNRPFQGDVPGSTIRSTSLDVGRELSRRPGRKRPNCCLLTIVTILRDIFAWSVRERLGSRPTRSPCACWERVHYVLPSFLELFYPKTSTMVTASTKQTILRHFEAFIREERLAWPAFVRTARLDFNAQWLVKREYWSLNAPSPILL